MSLLDQLWDDTVAGPPPESGLGKLRKNSTFNARSSSVKESEARYSADGSETKVTRSIMILKPPQSQTASPPLSPAGSTPPVSPFAGRETFRFRRKSTSDTYEKACGIGPGNPRPPHDV